MEKTWGDAPSATLKMSYAIRYPNKQEIKISNSKINKYKEKKHYFTKEEVLSPKLMVTLFCHKKKIQYIGQCIISQLTQQKSYHNLEHWWVFLCSISSAFCKY